VDHAQSRLKPTTIAAIATPPGRGGVGIVRISGPRAPAIGRELAGRSYLQPRYCHLCRIRDAQGEPLDRALVIAFPAPHSYTGEDVVEVQGHGGPAVLQAVLEAAWALGAQPAEPGEFTRRAYLNDRLSLDQAEAVANLIEADSRQAARAAQRSLEGELGRRCQALAQRLLGLRVWVEGALDFPDEEIDLLAEADLEGQLRALESELTTLRQQAARGVRLNQGFRVVLAGRPNAGKSSLLNHLAGRDSAIVTERAGTTRDVLRETIHLHGFPVELVDTAGLRESTDVVEVEGVRRAREQVQGADWVCYLVDSRQGWGEADEVEWAELPGDRALRVWTKADGHSGDIHGEPTISVTGPPGTQGLEEVLSQRLGALGGEDALGARQRHVDALDRAGQALSHAHQAQRDFGSGDLVAQGLRQAQEALGTITGRVDSEDLLGEIFATFCVGK